MNRTGVQTPPELNIPVSGPIINRVEAERASQTYREYTLTECERQAYIAKYGAPTAPYKPKTNGYDAKRGKGGKA